jgi:glutaredoxin
MTKLYYKEGCGNCVNVKTVLEAYGIKYTPINLSEKDKIEERKYIREIGVKYLPIIVLDNGKIITDCTYDGVIELIRYGDLR